MKSHLKPEVFVVGHERSGTTLLRAILEAHGGFTITPNDADLLLLLEKMSKFQNKGKCCLDELSKDVKLKAWNIDWSKIARSVSQNNECHPNLYKIILEEFWSQDPEKRKATKRPRYEYRIDQIKKLFPDSRILAILRDPRAVLASKMYYRDSLGKDWKKLGFLHTRLITSLMRWKKSLESIRQAQVKYGEDTILVIRYEDLVRNPKTVLNQIFFFLDEDYDEIQIFNGVQNNLNSNSSFLSDSLEKRVFKLDTLDRWKEKLKPVEQDIIECSLKQTLVKEGYQLRGNCLPFYAKMICSFNCLFYKLLATNNTIEAAIAH